MQFTTTSISLLALATTSVLASPVQKTEPQMEKRFNGGWCGVHLHVSSGDNNFEDVTAKVYDGNSVLLTSPPKVHSENGVITMDIQEAGMPQSLHIAVTQDGQDDNIASFTYGDDWWQSGPAASSNGHCKVGQWDLKYVTDFHETVDLDCGFSC
ncbi:hypothetical protein F4778DRAFT_776487 [Xylariomycetidae sp. FL2044]|nr:hypothetical protein F4778DRAFT_776487 [Xylariomycetidae sp. FL2044]